MNVLVVDVGGTHVKLLATGQSESRKFVSGPTLTAKQMVAGSRNLPRTGSTMSWPSATRARFCMAGRLPSPITLSRVGWGSTIKPPSAALSRLSTMRPCKPWGATRVASCLFLGLGTGLGSTMIVEGIVEPMELAHLPYRKGTYEDYVGIRGLERVGKKKWRRYVADVVARLIAALEPDDVVLGGGNVKKLKELPPGCRAGDNANAFLGGFRLWEEGVEGKHSTPAKAHSR